MIFHVLSHEFYHTFRWRLAKLYKTLSLLRIEFKDPHDSYPSYNKSLQLRYSKTHNKLEDANWFWQIWKLPASYFDSLFIHFSNSGLAANLS